MVYFIFAYTTRDRRISCRCTRKGKVVSLCVTETATGRIMEIPTFGGSAAAKRYWKRTYMTTEA